MPAIVSRSSTSTTPFSYKPMTPPPSHRSASPESSTSPSPAPTTSNATPSPSPSLSTSSPSLATPIHTRSPSSSIRSVGRPISRSSFSSESRYSPYPRVEVKMTRNEEDVARDVRIGQLNLDHIRRSASPQDIAHEDVLTPRPPQARVPAMVRPRMRAVHSSPQRERDPRPITRRPAHQAHRRAYSMSQISYGFMLFPSPTHSVSVPARFSTRSPTPPSHHRRVRSPSSSSLSMSLSPFPMSLSALPSLASSPSSLHHGYQAQRDPEAARMGEARTVRRMGHARTQSATPAFPISSSRSTGPVNPVRTPSPLRNTVRFAPSPASSPSPISSRTPSPPLTQAHQHRQEARSTSPNMAQPHASAQAQGQAQGQAQARAQDSRRLIFVNPAMAAHLKHGGMVSIKAVDGSKVFRVCAAPSFNIPKDKSAPSRMELGPSCRVDARLGGVKMTRSGGRSRF
ncbi:hypothetical protein IAT40_007287 [Kwoniella sp. CBS 6097]